MPELEVALRQLGASIELPPEPDLAAAVRQRLGKEPARGFAFGRLAAVGLAVVALALAGVLAVPAARSTILEWLGIEGVAVTRVESLPDVPLRSDFGIGEQVTLAEARRRAPWLVQPTLDRVGPPDEVYVSDGVPGGQVTFIWGRTRSPRLLMTQSPGTAFADKMLSPETGAEPADVRGSSGVWFSGEPHVFVFRDRNGEIREETARLAGNTLLWQHGRLTVRLEGRLSRELALEIARSVR